MADVSTVSSSSNGTPVRARPEIDDARGQELARTLEEKLRQGFTIESESETQTVLAMKGRRRWFGLSNSPSVRYELTQDETGRVTSRRL